MPDKSSPQPDNPEQSKRFIEAAKKAEAAESAKEAERAVRSVIRHQPKAEG